MMGLILSPSDAIQGLLWESEVVWRDRIYPGNPFIWDKVRLKLPGDPDYSPTFAWMPEVRGETQELSEEFMTYVDESRVTYGSATEAWRAARTFGYFGSTWCCKMKRARLVWKGRKEVHGGVPSSTSKKDRYTSWWWRRNGLRLGT